MPERRNPDEVSQRPQVSIAAVIVTFNRKELLAECLDGLLCQSRPVERIFVLDQASADGTAAMLRERSYLENSRIVYSRSEKNTGGAGGFQRGVELAYNDGADWIWLMDDDAIAEPSALEKMLPYTRLPGVCAVANAKMRTDGTLDPGHFALEKSHSLDSNPPFLTFSSFVGLMVARDTVSRIGFPKAEFFLQGDDTEYCIRIRTEGRIVLARDAVLLHKEISRPPQLIRRFGRGYTIYSPDRFCFQYFLWRNRVWIELYGRGIRPDRILWLIGKVVRITIRTCLVDRKDLSIRLYILFRAFIDGTLGRFDNEFPFRMRDRVLAARSGRF